MLLKPLTMAIEFIVRQLLKLTPTTRDDEANILAAHEEIRGTIELQTMGGAVAKGDAAMLGGVLDLRDLQVPDIMVHRTKMQTINVDEHTQRSSTRSLKSQYTRVPIWKDEPENIVGVLHTKDLLVGAGARRLGRGQARRDEPCRAALVRARHDRVNDQLNAVPEAQGADRAGRRRVRRGAGPDHARGHPGGDRRPDRR